MSTLDIVKVKEFWDSQATNDNIASEAVTHRDHQQRLLEMNLAAGYMKSTDRLLDVGCGNGYSTAFFAPKVAEVMAVDYSAAMIERASREYPQAKNVRWEVQDALSLNVPENNFDIAITLRCLINLGSWDAQQKAILGIHSALRSGGIFLMGEGSQQGRALLNETRKDCGLQLMPSVAYNLDLDEQRLWPFLEPYFKVQEVRRLGIYDLISRIIHPLLVSPEEPRYDARINEIGRLVSEKLDGTPQISREFIAVLIKR